MTYAVWLEDGIATFGTFEEFSAVRNCTYVRVLGTFGTLSDAAHYVLSVCNIYDTLCKCEEKYLPEIEKFVRIKEEKDNGATNNHN